MQTFLRITLVAAAVLGFAVRDARAKEPTGARPTQVVLLDPVAGSEGEAKARKTLFTSLTKHLKARGLTVTNSGSPRFRVRPSLVRVDVVHERGGVEVKVKAAVAFVDHGLVDAGFEQTASLRSESPKADPARLGAKALDAAAGAMAKDVAQRIAEKR
jgi:hypothetical protein